MSVWGLVGFAIGFLLVRVVRHYERKRIRQEEIRQIERRRGMTLDEVEEEDEDGEVG